MFKPKYSTSLEELEIGMIATQILKKLRCLLYLLPFFIFTSSLIADPLPQIKDEKKDLKTLILIIASDSLEAYLELQKIWRTYMHSDPEHFEVYFIRGDAHLSTPYLFTDDNLIVKTEEGYTPGIINKTLLSMEVVLPRLKEFDYVIRTNLSSFYVFPKLLEFLKTLPREKCCAGVTMYFTDVENAPSPLWAVSGAGIILSRDLVETLVDEKKHLSNYKPEKCPDDIIIGWMLSNKNVQFVWGPRVDFQTKEEWMNHQEKILETSFHFRAKSNYNFRKPEENFEDELYINRELLKRYYPNLSKAESISTALLHESPLSQ